MEEPSQEEHHDQAHLDRIVDIEAIENQKENIQPIKSGRSAARLVSLFNQHLPPSKPSSTSDHSTIESPNHHRLTTAHSSTRSSTCNPVELIQHRKKTHEKFQAQIRVLEDALDSRPILDRADRLLADQLIKDPIELYLQYIRWTIESYPSGGSTAESRLIPLLEQVTRKFMNDRRYQQDLRYLKCWIFYSDQVNTSTTSTPTPTSRSTTQATRNDRNPSSVSRVIPNNLTSKLILNFLIHNRIGTKTGLLYQEYFKLFLPIESLSQRSDQADRFKLEKVLKFGISQTSGDDRQVIVELLEQLPSIDTPPRDPDEVQITTDPEENQKNDPNPKPTKTKMTQSKRSKSKTKMKVFEDLPGRAPYEDLDHQDLQNDRHPNLSLSRTDGIQEGSTGFPSPFPLISKWDNLGTVQSNKKQNTLDPSTWKGQKLPMIKSSSTYPDGLSGHGQPSITSRPSKIKVYEDPFPADESYSLTPIERTSSHDLPPERDRDPSDDKEREDDDHYKLLDDLLSSEIDHQVHSIHEHYSNDSERSDEAYQVLKFDPFRFQSLKR